MSGSYPQLSDSHLQRGYGTSQTDFAQHASGNPTMNSPLSQSAMQHQGAFNEDFDASQRGSSLVDGGLNRSSSRASTLGGEGGVSRSNTLKKRASVKRSASLKRSSSKRSLKAGSLKGFGGVDSDSADFHSFSFTPVPTTGTPTEILANRFQAWRQLLKSLITYFREIQTSYETRAKALHKVQNTISNITHPAVFMSHDGLGEATRILDAYHKRSIAEASKSREIENDVIGALTGLRSDLGQKIKEIKSLSGDFKNSVEKEKDNTRREVEKLQEALQHADHEDASATGKNDPFVVRLGVDRAIERQIDEENYLHRAYLNLESSGRELESIVVGEIQKAYNALAGILKREGDDAYNAVESLRSGPISMPKDQEWYQFVTHDPHFVDPSLPLRKIEEIEYPGKHHPSATEIRSGMLERKSKYLKSYTPGWYVLSPTHLHEFKSADKIYTQPPVMSLYLLDQKLGSRSEQGSSSNKFMLKGKQSGGMHKGHNWVFRAESYDTMMAWYNDIRVLTEKTGAERTAFVRKHARSVSGTSDRGTVSSDGDMEDDEADRAPYAADVTSLAQENPIVDEKPRRPAPGGRFPSDLVLRKAGTMSSTNDGADDSDDDQGVIAAAGAIHGSRQEDFGRYDYGGKDPYRLDDVRTEAGTINDHPGVIPQQHDPAQQRASIGAAAPAEAQPVQTQTYALPTQPVQPINQQQQPGSFLAQQPATNSAVPQPEQSLARQPTENYGNWFGGAAVGAAGVGAGVLGAEAYRRHQNENTVLFAEQPVPHEEERGLAYNPQTNSAAFAANNTSALEPQYAGGAASLDAVTNEIAGSAAPAAGASAPVAVTDSGALPVGSSAANPQGISSEPALGGLEARGAHETGQFFPKVVRHDTNLSISALHVPGEFPKRI